MSQAFDPYRQWLGIAKDEPRPLNYYRLLGVEKFESDPTVISNSADRQIDHLRKYSASEQGELAEQLINELIKAKLVLLKPERRETYNRTLLAAPQNSEPPNSTADRALQARPITPATTSARVELASDPAQWDLEGLVPPEPVTSPVDEAQPEPAAPQQPLYANNPTGPAVGYAPYPPNEPMPYAQAPVPYPSGFYSPAPLPPVAMPGAYYPQQPAGSFNPTALLPPHLVPQAYVAAASPLPDYSAGSYESDDDSAADAQELREQHDAHRQRRILMTVALSAALSLMILGTVVGLVVSKYGLNPSADEPVAANAPAPAAKLPIASPDTPDANPAEPRTLPVKTVIAEQPPEVLFDSFRLAAGKKFEWPAVKNPNVPQIVDFIDVNENPKLAYRYPGTHARMATVITQGYSPSRWSIENDQLLFKGKGSEHEFLLFGDPNWTDYTVEFETYFDEPGSQFPLGILFRCAADRQLPMFLLHGVGQERKAQLLYWEPELPNLGVLANGVGRSIDAVRVESSSPNAWRKTSVTVTEEKIVAQHNGKTLFDTFAKLPERGPVGIVFKASVGNVRIRNISVTAPDGRVLWQGVPELPPGIDKSVTRLWPQPDFRDWTRAPQPKNGTGDWQIQDGVQGQQLQANSRGGVQLSTKPFDCRNYIFEMKIRKLRGVLDFTVMTPHSNAPTQRPGLRLHMVPASSPIDTANARPLTIQFVRAANGYVFRQNGETIYSKAGNFELPEQGQIGIALTKPSSEVVIDEIVVRRLPDSFRLEELPRQNPKLPRAAPQLVIQTLPAPKAPALPVNKVEPPPAVAQLPYRVKPPRNIETPIKGLVLKQGEPFEWAPIDAGVNEQLSAVHYTDVQQRQLAVYRYHGTSSRLATVISRAHMPGRWAVENNELTFENSVSDSEFLLFGDPNWTDYTLEFESYVERTNAVCPVGVLFRCAEDHRLHLFQHSSQREKAALLQWRPEIPHFSPLNNSQGKPLPPAMFTVQNPGAWKKHSVTVAGDRIVAKRDKLVMFDNAVQMPEHGRVGMKFELVEDGKVHVRNIRVTSPDGTVLWEGLPELPTMLEQNVSMVWPGDLPRNGTKVPKKVENPGDWQVRYDRGQRPLLCAAGKQHPPLLFDDDDHANYILEVKIRKLRGEFDFILNMPKLTKEPETTGTRLHLSYANQPADAAGLPMFLQLTRGPDGFQLRVNDETVIQQRQPNRGFELTYYGFDLTHPDSEIEIEEINVRRVPNEFLLYDEKFRPRLNPPKRRGENGWELVIAPPGAAQPVPVAAANPAPAFPALDNAPPRNPLADIVAKFGLDPEAGKAMPAGANPDLMPRLTPLAALARNDEELQKSVDELENTRAAFKDRIQQIEEEYLKAFETEITRIRGSQKLNANERAALLEPLLEDKKAFLANRRFSLAHSMLPHNKAIALILIERQKLDRVYEQTVDRLFKEKKDEAAIQFNKARREDADLAPLAVFKIIYTTSNSGTQLHFEFLGDKTIKGNPKLTWTIDADKRLILAGPVFYPDSNTVEQMQISVDGRKLIGLKAIPGSRAKTGTVVTD